jgi:hypothetical protein
MGYRNCLALSPQQQHPPMVYSCMYGDRGGFAASRNVSAWMLKALRRVSYRAVLPEGHVPGDHRPLSCG